MGNLLSSLSKTIHTSIAISIILFLGLFFNNGGFEFVKKILTYPLIKMGDSSLTLQSLLILGILFVLVIVIEKIVRERVIMRIFEKPEFPEALEYGIARILGYVFMVIGFSMAFQIGFSNLQFHDSSNQHFKLPFQIAF